MLVTFIKDWLSLLNLTVKLNFFETTTQCLSRNWNAPDIGNILKREVIVYFCNAKKESIIMNTGLVVLLRS